MSVIRIARLRDLFVAYQASDELRLSFDRRLRLQRGASRFLNALLTASRRGWQGADCRPLWRLFSSILCSRALPSGIHARPSTLKVDFALYFCYASAVFKTWFSVVLRNEDELTPRRLTAFAFADIVGFSRLMSDDDVGTAKLWEDLRHECLLPLADQFHGRLAEFAGDALLIEFSSIVNALSWAVEAQRAVESTAMPEQRPVLQLRIAVNAEDVIVDDDHILGDGINIASRIHEAAEPGQIVVTSLARELVGSRVPVRFRNLGTPRLKNISRIVQLYAVEPLSGPADAGLHQPFLEWTSRPSVAVMPFRCISDELELDYFGSGITEDIITGLSSSRRFHVIARASTLQFADRSKNLTDIAAQLGVNYILDGSVRKQRRRLRISAELVSVAQNRSIWAEHFDGSSEDVFSFQDKIVSQVVGSFEPRLLAEETKRVRNRPTSSLDAYDCVLKASSQLYDFTEDSFRASGIALDRALELDPNYAQAHAYSAWRLNFLYGEERSRDPEAIRRRAFEHAQKAISLDPRDAFCQVVAGHLTSLVEGKPNEAISIFDVALSLDQNNALGWAMSGITMSYLGMRDEAMQRFQNAFKLSPFDAMNFSWWCGAGMAEFVGGNYNLAVDWLRKARRANPRYAATLRVLTASLALADRLEEAYTVAEALLELDESFQVDRFVSWYPLVRSRDKVALSRGLKLAELPH
ncbi:adenylate/guanylate cyclase domain-containing protein [Shimia sp.]|uniref:adenylate/guanylate cyclase domain-containing protein n=1 Tax=Shimia sp. TaxID=1954381 RepID=UPI003BACA0FE